MRDLLTNFRAARSAFTPLVDIRTPDAAATMRALLPELKKTALLRLDLSGLIGLNGKGKAVARVLRGHTFKTVPLLDGLSSLAKQPPRNAVVFFENVQMFWGEPATLQAIWNLRDPLKANGSMLVLLTSPGSVPPPILAQSVLVLDEPLPAHA